MSDDFIKQMSDDMRSVRPLPETDWNNVVRLLAEYFDLRGEHQRVLAELEALRTQWASVPWDAIDDCVAPSLNTYWGKEPGETVRAWFDKYHPAANAPKKAQP